MLFCYLQYLSKNTEKVDYYQSMDIYNLLERILKNIELGKYFITA